MEHSLRRTINADQLRKTGRILVWFFVVMEVYLMSFGPVLPLNGVKGSTGWAGLPSWVRNVYLPATEMAAAIPGFSGAYDHYLQWWIGMEN